MHITFPVHFQVSLAAPKLHQFSFHDKTKIEAIRFKSGNLLDSVYSFTRMIYTTSDDIETIIKDLAEFLRCSIDTIDGLSNRYGFEGHWEPVRRAIETNLRQMESCLTDQ